MSNATEYNLISVVVPVFNEMDNLDNLLIRLNKSLSETQKKYELILVDDGSSDGSAEFLASKACTEYEHLILVELSANFGQHAAVMAGFSVAKGDLVITIDADLQNPPEEIPKLIAKVEEGYDVVGSIRENRQDSWFRRFASRQINRITQWATGVKMSDFGCMLRAYDREVVNSMLSCKETSTFVPLLATNFTKNYIEINVAHNSREQGNSKYGFLKLINLQFDLLTSMTTAPLRLMTLLGASLAILGVIFGLILLIMRLIMGSAWGVNGVFPLFSLLFIFSGAQFIGLGLLGEYIGRIYYDVRGRPQFVIERVVKSKL